MINLSRNIIFLILGQFISVFGGATLRFALSLYVLDKTGRADIFATMLAISNIPILFSPVGGVLADRFNRRTLMVLMDIGNAILAIVLYLVLGMEESVLLIGIVLFLLAMVGSFDTPVVTASIPLIVEEDQLEQMNGLVNGVLALSSVAAPIIGGVLYSSMGVGKLVLTSCLFFIIAAIIELFLKIPIKKRSMNGRIMKVLASDLAEGFHQVRSSKLILNVVIIGALINFVLVAFFVVGMPIILRVGLQLNDTLYGIGMGLAGLSTILAALFAGPLTKRLTFNNLYITILVSSILLLIMSIGVSLGSQLFGNTAGFILFTMTCVPIGILMSLIDIYLISVAQRITPKTSLGKVMAIITAVAKCILPVGQVMIGLILKDTTGDFLVPILFIAFSVFGIALLCRQLFLNISEEDYLKKETF